MLLTSSIMSMMASEGRCCVHPYLGTWTGRGSCVNRAWFLCVHRKPTASTCLNGIRLLWPTLSGGPLTPYAPVGWVQIGQPLLYAAQCCQRLFLVRRCCLLGNMMLSGRYLLHPSIFNVLWCGCCWLHVCCSRWVVFGYHPCFGLKSVGTHFAGSGEYR